MGCEYLPWYPPVRRNIPYADPVTLRCLPEPARFAHSEWQAFQPSRRACTHYTGADCSAKQSAADYGLGCCLGPGLGRTPRFSLQPHAQLWHYPPRAAPSRSLGAPSSPRAVDGKTLCGSADEPTTPAVRLLSAFVHDLGITLAQVPIPPSTTEEGTLAELLNAVVVEGTIITGDAHYTTREVIRTIRKKGGTTSCALKTINRTCCAR